MRERQDFPIPRELHAKTTRKKAKKLPEDICLHHVIRKSDRPYSAQILEYDQKFRDNRETPELISDREISSYQKLITDASVEELKNYDVILCTCSASASIRLKRGANIVQIIIDECAMSMEPDSLISIARFESVTQIVLLGDHMQLQPIVMNSDAKELGLNVSLFERYALSQPDRLVMLDEQYRMVCVPVCLELL